MVDFIKAMAVDYLHIRDNSFLEFKNEVNTKTGELSDWWIAEYYGLKFASHNTGRLMITGSLHKYWNKGEHNWNQFTISDLHNVLQELEILFDLNLADFQIQNIEFGVNIEGIQDVKNVLLGLFEHRNTPFDFLHKGYYRQCELSEYLIKCYDKSEQHNLPNPNMRFELKYRKSRGINAFGIYTLLDLLISPDWVELVSDKIIRTWNKITFFDPCLNRLTDQKLIQYANPNFWITGDKMQKSRAKKVLKGLIQNNPENTKYQIDKMLKEVLGELDNVTNSHFKYRVIS